MIKQICFALHGFIIFHFQIHCFIYSTYLLTFSFSTKSTNAVCSISTDWPWLSYKASTKWKKFDFRRLAGGCFSKCTRARPTPLLETEKLIIYSLKWHILHKCAIWYVIYVIQNAWYLIHIIYIYIIAYSALYNK